MTKVKVVFFIKLLIGILLGLSALFFFVGLHEAVEYSQPGKAAQMPEYLRHAVIVIGGVLATNLGAVVGIKLEQLRIGGFTWNSALLVRANDEGQVILQVIAAYLYVFALCYATLAWWRIDFTEEPADVVVILPQLSQTLLGVVVGLLAVALGRQE